jgi:hypothetical protein
VGARDPGDPALEPGPRGARGRGLGPNRLRRSRDATPRRRPDIRSGRRNPPR